MSGNLRRYAVLGAVLTIVSVAALLLYRHRATATSNEPVTPEDRVALLEKGLRAIEDGDRNAPRDRWDPEYVQRQIGTNPDSILDWVRNNTDWIPYYGELRGPVGVLMDRQGNSLDRALLLATLLRSAGLTPKLANNELTEKHARDLLPQLVAQANRPSALQAAPSLTLTASQYGLDTRFVQVKLEQQTVGVRQLYTELQNRVAGQTRDLISRIMRINPDDDWDDRAALALAALRDHWWVIIDVNGREQSLDPISLSEASTTTMSPDAVPDSLHHSVTVRVRTERWLDGQTSQSIVIDQRVVPSDLGNQEVILQFWPKSWPKHLDPNPSADLGLTGQALSQTEWSAAIVAGKQILSQGVFNSHAQPQQTGGNPFGGLGRAIGKMAAPAAIDNGEMTAAWIEYEIHAPRSPARVIRRTVFDLFGASRRSRNDLASLQMDERKRLIRSLALMMRTEILPLTSRLAPDLVAHLAAQSLLANSKSLHILAAGSSDPAQIDEDSLMADAQTPLSPLYSLALARLEWSRYRDESFIDQINLITRHHHAGIVGDGFAVRGSIEILAGDIGVSLAARDAFPIRQYQGVLDANADALWWTGEGLNNTSEAFASSPASEWRTVSPRNVQDLQSLNLPADALVQMKSDVDSGLVIVAPSDAIPRGPDRFVGWWRVNPRTGATDGIAASGWGQCGAEESSLLNMASEAINSFAYEYALCQGIALSINSSRAIAEELQKRGLWFWWVAPIESKGVKDVVKEANKGCLIGAMMGGFLATMPILLFRAEQVSMELALEQSAQKSKFPKKSGATQPSIEMPEGVKPKPKGNPKGFDPGQYVTEAPKITEPETQANPTKPNPTAPEFPEPVTEPAPTKMPPTEPASTKMPPTEPAPTEMPPTEPAPTEPAPTEPAVPRDPAKTEPQLAPPDFDPAEPGQRPATLEEARAEEIDAGRQMTELNKASTEALTEAVQYRQYKPQPARNWPGDPAKWDPQVDADNFAKFEALHRESIIEMNRYNAAKATVRDMVGAQRGAAGRGGFQPAQSAPAPAPVSPANNFPGCPPNCGNNNVTGPASPVTGSTDQPPPSNNLAVGSSAISSSMPFPLVRKKP